MDTIFKFLHSIMYTLTLQISKLTKAVVLNSFPHGRIWQFVYKESVRCTRLMQRSLQVVIRQMFVLCSLKIEAQSSEPMSFTFHSALRKVNTDRTFYRWFPPKFGYLAKQFQRRRLLEIGLSETRIGCGDHVCQRIRMKCAIFIEDLP